MAAMRDRHAMTGSQPAEIMPFYCAGKPFADADPDDVDTLAREKMRSSDFRADREHGILGDAKLSEAGLRLDLPLRKMAALGLCHSLDLSRADAELQGRVPVPFPGAHGNHLAVVNLEHRHRHMISLRGKDPSHANLLRQEASAHRANLKA